MLIPKQVFEVARVAAPRGNWEKPELACVNFERDGEGKPLAVAVDGKQLLLVKWEEMPAEDYPGDVGKTEHVPGFSVMIHRDSCKEAAKLAPGKSALAATQVILLEEDKPAEGKRTRLAGTDLETVRRLECRLPDASFPDWRRALERTYGDGSISIKLSAARLACLLDAIEAVCGNRTEDEVDLTLSPDAHVPIMLRAESQDRGVRATAVLMPLTLKSEIPAEFRPLGSGQAVPMPETQPEASAAPVTEATPSESNTDEEIPF